MEAPPSGTQLADSRPQLDFPLRVSIPINAPARKPRPARDELILLNAFKPNSLAAAKKLRDGFAAGQGVPDKIPLIEPPGSTEYDAQTRTALKDFEELAFSSKRAGKKDVEASAYVSLGVIYDNQGKFLKAIEQYKLYLEICEELNDPSGAACASNCLTVNYMLLASPPSDAGTINGTIHSSKTVEYLNRAVFYSSRHLEIGPDSGGRFVANTNLGKHSETIIRRAVL
jgi:tetratricopeptide (TPR) repeat protein